jgi:hypothetical protein
VTDGPGLDHALLAEGEGDEGAELDDLLVAEVLAEPSPERLVDALRAPDQVARVEQGRLLALAEPVGALEVQQLDVVRLGQSLVSPPERPL